ncbi:MAG TPA: OmpA family protein [Pseudomonadales bacterium]
MSKQYPIIPMWLARWLACAVAILCAPAAAEKVQETTATHAAERHLSSDQTFTQWAFDPDRLAQADGDRVEKIAVATVEPRTVKLKDVVRPIYFDSGVAEIPASTVAELRHVLESMRERRNVRLNLVGHADSESLSPELEDVYGDNFGLSRERAGQVADYLQAVLALPAEALSIEWAGDTRPVASNDTEAGRALNRRVEVEVWYDELDDGTAIEERVVIDEIERVKVCRVETVCKLRYLDGHDRRARVLNLITPLHYGEEGVEVTDEFTAQVQRTMASLGDRQNVTVKFIGYTDNQTLAGRTARIYGTHEVLSKARARRVALAIQDRLGLETAAVASNGLGASRPLASNETTDGRALNRRVEVEFWYDDPLQDLPDEPQLCPGEPGAETVTRVYDPPWGGIGNLELEGGRPVVPAGYTQALARALGDVADKRNPRLRILGYTRNERLDRRTASVYGDDIGLSAARARRAMETLSAEMGLAPEQAEFEGRGYVHSADVVNAGFVQDERSYVAVQVVYDDLAVVDDTEGVEVTPLTRELETKNPYALNLMRITVDGEPIDDPNRSSADVQRCTDVAMKGADIRFGFDNLSSKPRLSVSASTAILGVTEAAEDSLSASGLQFSMYANYSHFIDRSEIRIFDRDASTQTEPMAVIAVGPDGQATWEPVLDSFAGPVRELKYLLRAYDAQDRFDETTTQPLWLVRETGSAAAAEGPVAEAEEGEPTDPLQPELLSGYGENALAMHNIRLSSGTVRVSGSEVPEGHRVYVAGREVPVDAKGNFVSEEILPEGAHTVEVAVLDDQGSGESYLRDLAFEPSDWFYVGMADLTFSHNETNGPMELLMGDDAPYDYDSSADGRLAFFVSGKFGNKWRLTASADTREDSLDKLFTNFLSKTPDSLFRRMEPDDHYPTFGDDGTVEELAPTLGKFYVKLSQRENHVMWGNFKVGYMDNELAQIDRGLYGANFHYQAADTTSFGEQKFSVDAFAAEPGTVASRQEFRGTGGSLYFLRHQDLMVGSERVRVEVRDRSSGLVTGVVNLNPGSDYDVDYLQGSIMLAEPLASTVGDDLLVRSGALGGDEAYLVVRYEYTPGFDEIDALSVGGQMHYWINDHIKVGLTANANEEGGTDSGLHGADLTLRKSADSWVKLQVSQSEGLVTDTLRSSDGGFEFAGYDPSSFSDASAGGYRADVSVGLDDFSSRLDGRITLYAQDLDAGYSGPGLTTVGGARNFGGTFTMPVTRKLEVSAKSDLRKQRQGVETTAHELDLVYDLTQRWDISAGVRHDELTDRSPVVAPTQDQGQRIDAVMQVGYDSLGRWKAYGFVQDTVSSDGDRPDNARLGLGGQVRVTEKMTIDSEFSTGDLGTGGKLGTTYMHSERTSLYLNYAMDNERTEPMLRAPRGSEGNLVSGIKTRLSDATSVYVESRYRHGDTANGLTYASGVNFTASNSFNIGANTDIGTLKDLSTGAETDRKAAGVRVAFGTERLQLSSGIEYRSDDTEQLDDTTSNRKTWLFRNTLKYQLNESSRLVGKLNHADSTSSLGNFFAGGYTEAVFGYAYRPVRHDRLNTLMKYTYFYNVPTTDQVSLTQTAADFVQKSHIASVDVTYDLTSRWSIGGKYAYRLGEISYDRENPEFFSNTASLYVVRLDWEFRENWEIMAETRLLDMADFQEQRQGYLVAVSRNFGDHFKVGAGYNFTDFSSDLTDLSFDHQGMFLNLTGAF